jgi:glycoside/pentoside/hexuronide:cation symporter, GPH family
MFIFAGIGVICFLITFFTTKERIVPPKEQKTTVAQDMKDLTNNRPWIIMLIVTVLVFITLALKGGMNIYYYKYYLTNNSQVDFLNSVGFNNIIQALSNTFGADAFSAFSQPDSAPYATASFANAFSTIAMIIGIFFTKPLADRFGKRNVFGLFITVSAVCLIAISFYNNTAVWPVFITQVLHGFLYGITIPLLWAMIADVADYSEWKNNRRATAIIFSAMIFGLKMGLSIGGALSAWLLSRFGYQADAVAQTTAATNGIKLLISLIPGAIFIAAACLLFGYSINKKAELQIEKALKEKRKLPEL